MRYAEGRRRGRADLAVTVLLLGLSGVVASLDPGLRAGLARGVQGSVLLPVLRLHEGFADRARLAERLAGVRAERDGLAREVVDLRERVAENRRLRELLGLGDEELGSSVAADLVPGRPRVGDADQFLLRGPALGSVRAPAGVFTGEGLVGVLRAAEGSTGRGEFWTHPDFRVSVRTADGEVSGIVRALAEEDGEPVMLLEGAPFQGEIPAGTELYTSGLGGIHPPGVRVGTVVSVSGVESGWAKSYVVRPAVRPAVADVVLVWRRSDP